MISVILASHGTLAKGFVEASRVILGEQENLYYFLLDDIDGHEVLKENLKNQILKSKEEGDVIVLTDLQLGTPFNCTVDLMETIDFYHITGINLAVLLEILATRTFRSAEEICADIIETSKENMLLVNEFLNQL